MRTAYSSVQLLEFWQLEDSRQHGIPDALREINCWWVCPVPMPDFSTVLERSGRGLSGEIVGIIVAMRTQCYSCRLRLLHFTQARSAPRGWHHFEPNILDGHQNGLIRGPLVPWNPVNALQSWRRLCDPNGSVRVVILREQAKSKIEQGAAVNAVPMRALPPALRPRGALFSSPLMRAKLFPWHATRRCEEQGRAKSAVRLPPPHQQRGCDPW
jgi:hypothetical protein